MITMLSIKDLVKTYKLKDQEIPAVAGVSFSFPERGMFFILGKSGCGKTSLLNAVSGLDSFDSGDVVIDEKNLANMTERDMDALRNTDIGIIFQSYNLVPEMTVYQNIEVALKIQKWDGKTEEEVRDRILKIMKYIGLAGYENRVVSQLSGGERQRIAIARALVKDSKILLADEPTGNLDAKTGAVVLDLLKKISEHRLVIVVTHDAASAERYGDCVLNIRDGQIVQVQEREFAPVGLLDLTVKWDGKEAEKYEDLSPEEAAELAKKLILTPGLKEAGLSVRAASGKKERQESETDRQEKTVSPMGMNAVISPRSGVITAGLTLRNKLRFSGLFMKKNKVRLIVSIALMAVTLFLLTAAAFITHYDDRKVLTEYFDRYAPENLTGAVDREYTDMFYRSHSYSLKSGPVYMDQTKKPAEDTGHPMIPILMDQALFGDMETENYTGTGSVTMVALTDENEDAFPVADGRTPQTPEEIAITDYLAHVLNVSVGDSVETPFGKAEVSGIISTDYVEYELIKKLRYEGGSDFTGHLLNYRYGIALMLKEAFGAYQNDSARLTLPMSLFTVSEYPHSYVESAESRGTIGGMSLVDGQALSRGRMPEKRGEVLISARVAERYEVEKRWTGESVHYDFIDIHDVKYNECFSDHLNMAEFFPEGVDVVGIYPDEAMAYADFLIADDVYKEIRSTYTEKYYFDAYLLNCRSLKDYKDLVYHAAECGLWFDEPAAYQIYDFKAMVTEILPVLWILLAAVSLVTLLNMISYISASIRGNSKNIGILRALGVTKRDVSAIFVVESFVVYWIAAAISLLLSLIFMKYVNGLYQESLNERMYNIITWDHLIASILIAITFVICALVSLIPIRKMERLTPIEIIRRHEK